VLFVPRRVVPRFVQLTPAEVADLWGLAQRCGHALEAHFGASAVTFAIQDGAAAGQTVPHVHIHLLPRTGGDFERNDEIYDRARVRFCIHARKRLAHADAALACALAQIDDSEREATQQRLSKDLDRERTPRTPAEMAEEAAVLRRVCAALL
jgi:bis(5'-adenosyl)-triphosphatase